MACGRRALLLASLALAIRRRRRNISFLFETFNSLTTSFHARFIPACYTNRDKVLLIQTVFRYC